MVIKYDDLKYETYEELNELLEELKKQAIEKGETLLLECQKSIMPKDFDENIPIFGNDFTTGTFRSNIKHSSRLISLPGIINYTKENGQRICLKHRELDLNVVNILNLYEFIKACGDDPFPFMVSMMKPFEMWYATLQEWELNYLTRKVLPNKENIAVQALHDIVDPVAAIKRDMEEGDVLNGAAVVQIMQNPRHFQSIAKKALKEIGEVEEYSTFKWQVPGKSTYKSKILL